MFLEDRDNIDDDSGLKANHFTDDPVAAAFYKNFIKVSGITGAREFMLGELFVASPFGITSEEYERFIQNLEYLNGISEDLKFNSIDGEEFYSIDNGNGSVQDTEVDEEDDSTDLNSNES
jgi:hypothetical protein